MAFQDLLQSAKRFFGPDNSFFHGPQDRYEQPQQEPPQQMPPQDINVPQMNPQQQYEQQFAPPQGYQHPYAQPQHPSMQQMPPQQMDYQQPVPQPVQQDMNQPFQQGYRPQQQTVTEPYVAPRNRRSAQHQQQMNQPQQLPMQQMPQEQGNVVNFPGAAPQQPEQPAKLPSTCVINTRSMADCRNAIGILRAGDCVIAVMDSITDQTELRRYVDTLNGACFSLGCTMTRLASRVGVYLLAPAGIKVYTDSATTQMNGAARPQQKQQRPAMQQPFQATPFQQPQMGFAPQQQMGYQQPAPQPQPSLYQQMQYQQPQSIPQPQPQQYQQQAPAQGYAPDTAEAEYSAM